MAPHHFGHPSIQESRREDPFPPVTCIQHDRHEGIDTPTRQGTHGYHRCPTQYWNTVLHLIPNRMGVIRGRVLFIDQQVHFVGGNHQGPSLLDNRIGNGQFLSLQHTRLGIQYQNRNIGQFHGSHGILYRQILFLGMSLCHLLNARRVHQTHGPTPKMPRNRNGITCQTRHFSRNDTFLTQQGIDECRFAHILSTQNGQLQGSFVLCFFLLGNFFFFFSFCGILGMDALFHKDSQVRETLSMFRGNGNGLSESKGFHLLKIFQYPRIAIMMNPCVALEFIDQDTNHLCIVIVVIVMLLKTSQFLGHVQDGMTQPGSCLSIQQEENEIGLSCGDPRLFSHLDFPGIPSIVIDSCRIDHSKVRASDPSHRFSTISRRTGNGRYNGTTTASFVWEACSNPTLERETKMDFCFLEMKRSYIISRLYDSLSSHHGLSLSSFLVTL
mmetsp:Transcript_34337/g.79266  ORF Transcript_34337/g.79266 Transcript_34337/m.79266 type:complete len:440 (+) Transcript_34337:258-1577(+)